MAKPSASIMRPGRLFWKLFLAFMMAIAVSFLIGLGILQFILPDAVPLDFPLDAPLRIAQMVQTQGPQAAKPSLQTKELGQRFALLDAGGAWMAGSRIIGHDGSRLSLTAPDGSRYWLVGKSADPPIVGRTTPLLITAVVGLFFSAGMAWYLARPISHLSRGFRAMGAGHLATRLHPLVGRRRDEIADLTREFDGMAAQLQQLMLSQTRLLHDVSHELRSPLARLQVAIGLLRQTPERLSETLLRVENEADRLDRLIGELLTLAWLEAGGREEPNDRIDIIDLLTAIVDDANFEAGAKDCEVRLDADNGFVTTAYGELLYRAFENIIRNAVKFSPRNARIDVIARVARDMLDVTVTDQGPGVPTESLQSIFEPFKRFNTPDSADTSGFGLGLAIAKHAIEDHGGTISASHGTDGKGLLLEIRIPRKAM